MDKIGLMMREARKRKNLTVREVLKQLGRPYLNDSDRKLYSNLESGGQYPHRKTLKEICKLLELDYAVIAEGFAERLYLHKLEYYLKEE